MKRVIALLVWLWALMVLTGCATRTSMAFEDATAKVDEQKAVFLMSAKLKNEYRPNFQPKMLVLHVERAGGKEVADRLNFVIDEKGRMEQGADGHTYFMRLQLEPGSYVVRGITSSVFSFPIHAFFFTPMHAPLEVKAPGMYYLGRVNAQVRERKDTEFRAGPPLPLLDQAVAGASGGTFDIAFADAWTDDEAVFRQRFPVLAPVTVDKVLLSPFDRAAAQKWWDDN